MITEYKIITTELPDAKLVVFPTDEMRFDTDA